MNHKIIRLIIPVIVIIGCLKTYGATDTMTGIFNERIKTLEVRDSGGDLFAPPVVFTGGNDVLHISFDHLSEDRVYLRWRALRCDADWQPSSLVESEYLDGFNESRIEDFAFSGPTTVHYVHYSFNFPNDDINPGPSGNYLIQVYPENDPDDIWLQTRVMLSEQSAPIEAAITSRTDIDYNRAHQQLSITVDTERASVADPFNDIKIVVSQNGRADNEVMLKRPLRMSGSKAIFEHDPKLIFQGGNEYRRFEIISTIYPQAGVEMTEYFEPYYHFKLHTDLPRNNGHYEYDQTQSGRFVVREYNSSDPEVDADYAVVHFSLNKAPEDGEMIFLDGDFTSRRFDDESRMLYNPVTGQYEKALLLKQGHYNYQYLTVPRGASRGFTAQIEGDYYQTVNEYLIKVYARGPLDHTDRLIGITRIVADR